MDGHSYGRSSRHIGEAFTKLITMSKKVLRCNFEYVVDRMWADCVNDVLVEFVD